MVLPFKLLVPSTGILLMIKVPFIIWLLTILLEFHTFPMSCFPHNIGVSKRRIAFHCLMALVWSNILMNTSSIGVGKIRSDNSFGSKIQHSTFLFCFWFGKISARLWGIWTKIKALTYQKASYFANLKDVDSYFPMSAVIHNDDPVSLLPAPTDRDISRGNPPIAQVIPQ